MIFSFDISSITFQLPWMGICALGIAFVYWRLYEASKFAKKHLSKNPPELEKIRIKEDIITRFDFFMAALFADLAITQFIKVPVFTVIVLLYYVLHFRNRRTELMSDSLQREQKLGFLGLKKVVTSGNISEAVDSVSGISDKK